MREPHGNGSGPPSFFQGQLTMAPCRLHGPRGPTSSGPTWLSRRPWLSQQPAGSQSARWTGRSAGNDIAGGAGTGAGVGGAARMRGGGTAWAGCGAPERWRSGPGRSAPRHSREALLRACANAFAFCAVPSALLSAASSSVRASRHRMDSMGSAASAATPDIAAATRRKKPRGLRMRSRSAPGSAGFAALSDRFSAGPCLR